jgi:hypothetical protein
MLTLGSRKRRKFSPAASFQSTCSKKRTAETGMAQVEQELCRTGEKGEMRQKSHLWKELWGEEAKFRMACFGSNRWLRGAT